tara:strand:- start:390 stop:902 length:513 start_codon:yes stop_codon:yes gene_type:complete
MMTDDNRSKNNGEMLELHIVTTHLSASYLSSLLRALQASLREVAHSRESTNQEFTRKPQPVLILDKIISGDDLTLYLIFSDAVNSKPLPGLSRQTFNTFIDDLTDFVKGLPQPSLWGGASLPTPRTRTRTESDLIKRMDQLYRELRRSKQIIIRFNNRSVEIEGSRMEIQ